MMPTLVKHLKQHLSSASSAPEELAKCVQILQVIIDSVQTRAKGSDQQVNLGMTRVLLWSTITGKALSAAEERLWESSRSVPTLVVAAL